MMMKTIKTLVRVTDLRGRTVGTFTKARAFKEFGSVQYGYHKVYELVRV